ncbi:MAG: hypothetical protein QM691_06135 [Opitutaceae bacterium]
MNYRLLGCCVVCLGAGFGAGHWQASRGASSTARGETPGCGIPALASGQPQALSAVKEPVKRVASGPRPSEFRFAEDLPPELRERVLAMMRLDALRWLKNNGRTYCSIPVFSNCDEGTIDPSFARAYGISEPDVTRLTEALTSARERLRAAQAAEIKATVSPDNKTASVDLPALPELGGAAREEVLALMQDVLGPDRWPYFQELSAEAFGGGLGQFGTEDTRIEIERAAVRPFLKVKTYHVGGGSSGWSESVLEWDDLKRMAPVVAASLPETFRREMQQQ